MGKIMTLKDGYVVMIYSNENGEPIHVHIRYGHGDGPSAKFWLTSDRRFILA